MFQALLLQAVFRAMYAISSEESVCATPECDGEVSQAEVLMQRTTWASKQVSNHDLVEQESQNVVNTATVRLMSETAPPMHHRRHHTPLLQMSSAVSGAPSAGAPSKPSSEEELPLLPELVKAAATGKSEVLTDVSNVAEDKEDANGMIRSAQGPGAYEPLSEAGYQTVAASCCNYQMEEYVRRIVGDLGMELCGEGGLNGIVPFYTCSDAQDFDTLRKDLIDQATTECPVAASPGACPASTASCPGTEDVAAHRRRTCRGAVATTTAHSSTTAASTTTTTTTTEITTVTTTTVTTTTTTVTTVPDTTVTTVTTTTTTTLITTTTTSTGCKGETEVMDIFNAQLQQSNLGGQGPDAGATNMRFEGVGELDGLPYDLVVTSTSAYTPGNNLDNGFECGQPAAGCVNGRFVKINVAAGTSVDLTFTFQDSATQLPVTIPRLLFSVHDIDQLSSDAREHVYISGYDDDVIVHDGAEFIHSIQADGNLRLRSTTDGTTADDPTNPLALGNVTVGGAVIDQMKRSAAFVYSGTSSISLTLEVTCDPGGGCPDGASRNFLFTGDTNLVSCAGKALLF